MSLRSGFELAWVSHQGQTYYCYSPFVSRAPSNAVVKLVQAIFDRHRDLSFFILRNRIFTTAAECEFTKSVVKIAAKSVSFLTSPAMVDLSKSIPVADSDVLVYQSEHLQNVDLDVPARLNHAQALQWIQRLAGSVSRGEVLHDYNRAIGVIVVAEDNCVLSFATNSNSINKTLHAEMVAVQSYYLRTQSLLPKGARIYSTLKPCRMCASVLLHCSADSSSLLVFYLQDDPKQTFVNKDSRFQLTMV